MTYIHKTTNVLSSNLALHAPFRFHSGAKRISWRLNSIYHMTNNRSPAFTFVEMIVVMAVIGILMQTYLNDKDGILPVINASPGIGTTLSPVIYPKYIGSRRVFQSPFDRRTPAETDTAPVSYSINTNMFAASPGISRSMLKVVSPSMTFLMAPKYTGNPASVASWSGNTTSAPDLPVGAPAETSGTHSNGRQINVLFCDWHTETLPFGPASTDGTFQDTTHPLGLKHWDPTQ